MTRVRMTRKTCRGAGSGFVSRRFGAAGVGASCQLNATPAKASNQGSSWG